MEATLRIENIKGITKEVHLKKVNLLTGKNGSGKSAIVESVIMAIDGEHPVLGKTNAALCSVVSGDRGSVEMFMRKSSGEQILIKRIFLNGDTKSQEIYINGVKMLQTKAQEAVNNFMGGGQIRSLSPYKFINYLPKQRLDAIASIMSKAAGTDMRMVVFKELISGSEEVVGRARFALGKPVSELSDEETGKIVAESMEADGDYLSVVGRYDIPQGDYDNTAYVDRLIEINKEDIRECQTDIERKKVTVQEIQEKIGSLIYGETADTITAKIAEKEAELGGLERDYTEQVRLDAMRKRLDETKQAIGDDKDARKALKELQAQAKKLAAYKDAIGDAKLLEWENTSLEGKLVAADRAAVEVAKLTPEQTILKEEIGSLVKHLGHLEEDHLKLSVELGAKQKELSSIRRIEKDLSGDKCPTCGTTIDAKKLKTSRDSRIKTLEDEIGQLEEKMDSASSQKNAYRLDLSDKQAKLSEVEASLSSLSLKVQSQEERVAIQQKIKNNISAIEAAKYRDEYMDIACRAETIKTKIETLDDLSRQIAELHPKRIVALEDIERARGEKAALNSTLQSIIEADTLKKLIGAEQVGVDVLIRKRDILKKAGKILAECKGKTYSFIPQINKAMEGLMGKAEVVMSNDIFGITKDGITITDKALSGGERIMYTSSLLIASLDMGEGVKILELEGSELDHANIEKVATIADKSEVGIVLITSHSYDKNIEGINNIRMG